MTQPHPPRATDLVALISFDGEVFENQAITRDRLGKPHPAPHAIAATVQHWLGIGRRVWIDVDGRQIQGIATARELANHEAWEIDTLVDASGADAPGITEALLRQAADAAADAGVGRLLLRLRHDAPALSGARRAGFIPALEEHLWVGTPDALEPQHTQLTVREASQEDAFLEFQVYSRTVPADARRVLGMTFDEWTAMQERRWMGRGGRDYLVTADAHPCGALHVGGGQFSMLVEPAASGAADVMLRTAVMHLNGEQTVLALLPACSSPAPLMREHGFEHEATYVLLGLRTQSVAREGIRETVRVRGSVVPTSG
jgi:hypothetical protein